MLKKIVLSTILITIILLSTIAILVVPIISEYTRTTSSDEEVVVVIPQGASAREIASILKKNGVIDYEITFRLKLKNSPYRSRLSFGTFTLKKKMCLDDIVKELTVTQIDTTARIKLTIPEGFSAEKIAVLCEEKGLCSKEEFLKTLVDGEFDYGFIKDIPEKEGVKYKLQGYLFPCTYEFKNGTNTYEIIDTLLGEFEKRYNKVKNMLPEGMTMHEAIIRASLIEREAKLPSERVIISGVIQNRLDIDMKLQLDACSAYVVSDGLYNVSEGLAEAHKIDSPYNTYMYKGLPVGAICNPGIECIKAAMNPTAHNYLYYHTDTEKNDGSHIFSETYEEHKKTMR